MAKRLLPIGIDDMTCYIPKLYLDIETLAEKRNISYEKLSIGLGLHKMALPDAHEDAATMAAEAISRLIVQNQLDPRQIGRIYLGTESALDMAKPTATYATEMLETQFEADFGPRCFKHCDVVDLTFACIGAVDALLNCLDWVATNPENIAIVVASDVAKYELGSSGEYTQGAGAVAMLLRWNPRLLVVRRLVGVATEGVHDFYKPRRQQFSETPVFDGQYSNQCYQNRMEEALDHFRTLAIQEGLFEAHQFPALSDRWARMIFHLPYAYHAKRMYVARFVAERKAKGLWKSDAAQYHLEEPSEGAEQFEKLQARFLKSVSDSPLYQRFVAQKLEQAQRASQETGNLYTASIFLALMSALECSAREGQELKGKKLGFVAYGSGSKSKVFEAVVQPNWHIMAVRFGVFNLLDQRLKLDYAHYELLHTGRQTTSIHPEKGRWKIESIGQEGVTLGARTYKTF